MQPPILPDPFESLFQFFVLGSELRFVQPVTGDSYLKDRSRTRMLQYLLWR